MLSEPFYTTRRRAYILLLKLIWLDLNVCMPGINKFKSVYAKAYAAAPPMDKFKNDSLGRNNHITVISMLFCISLPNGIEVAPPITE